MTKRENPADQRQSVRVEVDYDADYRITGSEAVAEGRVKDLSAGGFLFTVGEALEPGTGLAITLRSSDSELVAAAWVLRCSEAANGKYEVACAFD